MASSPSLRVLLATFGSLGDLHPYIALALELQRRGHRPLLAATDMYREAVESRGIAFAPFRPGEADMPPRELIMPRAFDTRHGPQYLVRTLVMAHVRQSHADLMRLAEGCDVMVTHPLTVAAPLVAEQRGLPWAAVALAPMSLLSAHDPPLFPPAPWLRELRRLGVAPYRAVFGLVKLATRSWEAPLRALRAELGLPPRPQALYEGQYSPYLNLGLFSPLLAAPQPDWPAHTHVCGFARYDGAAADAATRERLERFLAAGEAPLVFALGSSAVAIAGDFWDKAIAAARALRRRAILITAREDRDIDNNIAEFKYLPYSAVFPHASVVVHQCGIGTLSQALAAGRPQLIVPVSFDQPDNARRATTLGVARVLPFQKVSAEGLERELRALLADPWHAQRAALAGDCVQLEDGAMRAAELVERLTAS